MYVGLGVRWVSVSVLILLLLSCENTRTLSFLIRKMGTTGAVPPSVVMKMKPEEAPKVAYRRYSVTDDLL